MLLIEFHAPFLLGPVFLELPSHALFVITWRGEGCNYMMRLGQTVKLAELLVLEVKVSTIFAKGCMFDEYVCYLT